MKNYKFRSKLCLAVTLSALLFGAQTMAAPKAKKSVEKVCPTTLGSEIPFPSKVEVQIASYDPKTRTFKVMSTTLPDEGSPDATLEGVAKGIGEVRDKLDKIEKDPKSIVGNIYMTSAVLPTLTPEEAEARSGCVPGKE